MSPVDVVIDALEAAGCGPRRSGDGASARCPAHEDRSPSLSVSTGADGQALVHCHAGCDLDAVLVALKLARADLFPPRERRQPTEVVATYDYTDEGARLLFQVVRYSSKAFKQRCPLSTGGWRWSLQGARRVLYRLPEVRAAVGAGRTVFVVEGEKDADALVAVGEVATCNPGGAGKWRDDYADALHGAATVVVVADRDEPGLAYARAVAASLGAHVGQVIIAEAKDGKDASDHLAAGYGVDDFQVEAGPGEGSTAELLERICQQLQRFIVWQSEEQVHFVALLALHTYVFEAFETTPYLDVSSAAKRSGKTRLLELLRLLVAKPWAVVEASEAVLFRKVDKGKPTLLVDEVDATFGKDSKVTEGIRAVFNAGYRAGAVVPRCVGTNHEPTDFEVYCPKAFAGLDGLPDTVKDRSGRVELRRRARHEPKPERLRMSKARPEMQPLVERLGAWAAWAVTELAGAEPELPDELSDRAQDGCEVLAAIADLAGGEWPGRARKAFVVVMGAEEETDYGVVLLGHVREAFDALGVDVTGAPVERVTTAELLRALVHRGDDAPWANWWGKDVEASELLEPSQRLAHLLKPYGVQPQTVRLGGSVAKGYQRADFADAWDRYVVL